MKKAIVNIIKFGAFEFMKSFLYQGEMFFDTVESFKKKDANIERYDENESTIEIAQVEWIKLKAENGRVFELSKSNPNHIKLTNAHQLSFDNTSKGNIYSCTAVTPDTAENFKKLDPRFQNFGDTVIMIFNPSIFIDRVTEELTKLKLDFEIGLVSYYNPNSKNGRLSVFDKKDSLSYQNEMRIWIKNSNGEPIKIHIGSIIEIAGIFKMTDLKKL